MRATKYVIRPNMLSTGFEGSRPDPVGAFQRHFHLSGPNAAPRSWKHHATLRPCMHYSYLKMIKFDQSQRRFFFLLTVVWNVSLMHVTCTLSPSWLSADPMVCFERQRVLGGLGRSLLKIDEIISPAPLLRFPFSSLLRPSPSLETSSVSQFADFSSFDLIISPLDLGRVLAAILTWVNYKSVVCFFFFHHLLNIAAKFIKPRFMSFPSFSYKIRRHLLLYNIYHSKRAFTPTEIYSIHFYTVWAMYSTMLLELSLLTHLEDLPTHLSLTNLACL